MADKADRSVNARIARARFPVMRTLEEFDFTFQPGLSAMRVRELATLAFLHHATNVLCVMPLGVRVRGAEEWRHVELAGRP